MASIILPRRLPRLAGGEAGFHLFRELVILAPEQNGAAPGGFGGERGFEQCNGLLLRERVQRGERSLLPVPFAVVGERAAEENLRLVADALRLLLQLGARAGN